MANKFYNERTDEVFTLSGSFKEGLYALCQIELEHIPDSTFEQQLSLRELGWVVRDIRGKLHNVEDSVCMACNQLWNSECRIYCIPHSDDEEKHRRFEISGRPLKKFEVAPIEACNPRFPYEFLR